MGTQGFSGRAVFGGRGGDRAPWRRITMLAASLAVLPLAAGCSGSSLPSFGSSQPQAASVPPPPSAPAGQQAYAPPPGQPGNPPASYAGGSAARPGGCVVGRSDGRLFQKLLRRLPESVPRSGPGAAGYDARASVYPQQSLADTFKGSADANQRPDPGGAGYPQQSPIRSPSANPPQQNAYVPHPPSTYVPSGQPYTPPQGQPAYAQSADQQNYAAPPAQPNASRTGTAKLRGVLGQEGQSCGRIVSTKRRRAASGSACLRRACGCTCARCTTRAPGLQRLNAVSQAVACRYVPRFDRTADPDRAAPAEHLYGVGATLYAARTGGQWRPSRRRTRGGTCKPRILQLAGLSEAIAVRSLLKQIKPTLHRVVSCASEIQAY